MVPDCEVAVAFLAASVILDRHGSLFLYHLDDFRARVAGSNAAIGQMVE
jgi:hypothetical protein